MIIKGFRFGMLLQLAIGPMCILVFHTSTTYGFFTALSLVIAIALIDALYIGLSGFGVAAIIAKKKVKQAVKIFGGIVLILFGFQILISIFQLSIIPHIEIWNQISDQNFFLQGILLTASNPLTILFWSGVFSAQVAEKDLTKKQLVLFGGGCVLSTLFFLTMIAVFGSMVGGFLPNIVINVLNGLVGILLIYFGIRLFR